MFTGGIILALIEGVGIAINRMAAEQFKPGKYIVMGRQEMMKLFQSEVAFAVIVCMCESVYINIYTYIHIIFFVPWFVQTDQSDCYICGEYISYPHLRK